MAATVTNTKTLVIDADAHVIENEHTWDYMEPAEQKFRPQLVSPPENPSQAFWQIGGKRRGFRFPTLTPEALRERGAKNGKRYEAPEGATEVHDVSLRLQIMDDTGIDVQICHNTLWIEQVAEDPDQEAAMCRSWNRWMAEAWRQGEGRIRWTCVFPSLNIAEALEQLRFAKANGAVGVCVRPYEGDRTITDPYFHPLYKLAEELDMAIVVHIANGSPTYVGLTRTQSDGGGAFATFRAPAVVACHSLLMSELPTLFPRLRWGFIEASAQWIPWVHREARNRLQATRPNMPANLLEEARVLVTAQNDDDIPYLIKDGYLNNLVFGTDFGHIDPSSDVDAIAKLQADERLTPDEKERILYRNPKALYGL